MDHLFGFVCVPPAEGRQGGDGCVPPQCMGEWRVSEGIYLSLWMLYALSTVVFFRLPQFQLQLSLLLSPALV